MRSIKLHNRPVCGINRNEKLVLIIDELFENYGEKHIKCEAYRFISKEEYENGMWEENIIKAFRAVETESNIKDWLKTVNITEIESAIGYHRDNPEEWYSQLGLKREDYPVTTMYEFGCWDKCVYEKYEIVSPLIYDLEAILNSTKTEMAVTAAKYGYKLTLLNKLIFNVLLDYLTETFPNEAFELRLEI